MPSKRNCPSYPRRYDRYLKLGLNSKQSMQVIDDAALRSVFDAVYEKRAMANAP